MRVAVLIISIFLTFETCTMAPPIRIRLPKMEGPKIEGLKIGGFREPALKNFNFTPYTFRGYGYPYPNDKDDRGRNFNSVIESGRHFGNLMDGENVRALRNLDHITFRRKRLAPNGIGKKRDSKEDLTPVYEEDDSLEHMNPLSNGMQ